MENTHEDRTQTYCWGCLSSIELTSSPYKIQCELLLNILKTNSIILCYVCKRIAQLTERFIRNVQSNQSLLEDIYNDTLQSKLCGAVTLTHTFLHSFFLPGEGDEESCMVFSSHLKMELDGDDDANDYQETCIKEEVTSVTTQKILPKLEVASVIDDVIQHVSMPVVRRGKRSVLNSQIPEKGNITLVKKSMSESTGQKEYTLQRVTETQCMKEREQRSWDSYYLSSAYRCDDCVKGFMHKTSFDRHMTSHSLSRGDFVCDICKQRFESSRKLAAHQKCHMYRYNCTKCEVKRVSHTAIRRHYAAKHTSLETSVFQCMACPKAFKNKVSLRKHEANSHSNRERVTCDSCHLTFISKETLLNHILRKHPADGAADRRRRHVCRDCGLAFAAPYLLRAHATRHSEERPYYCVECDRSFKTDKILTRHLKTASRHVFNADLHVPCPHCPRRFASRRALRRHELRDHLRLRPHACDLCHRAYLNSWSLREHKMYSHEGCKKERRYPCTLCDKVFDRSSILKSHIRTHTGERPYHCKHCPSQFVQSSQLRTHTNLVHLKLTRDGKPKPIALK